MTIHKQITDILNDAGTEGITLNVSILPVVTDDSMMYCDSGNFQRALQFG